MKKWVIPNKMIDNENIQYEWKTEAGACEVCQAMDGTIYESANDIPDRPHPNCKCYIEIVEKEKDITDPLELYKEAREEKQRTMLEIQKATGDTKSLLQEVNMYLEQVNKEEEKFEQFRNIVDFKLLEDIDIENFNKALKNIKLAKIKGEKVKNQLLDLHSQSIVLEGRIEKVNVWGVVLDTIKKTLEHIIGNIGSAEEIVKKLTVIILDKIVQMRGKTLGDILFKVLIANQYGKYHTKKYNMQEAFNLYKVASPEYLYNTKYVNENGFLYESINDLNDYQLEKDIHNRIKSDMNLNDCKVLRLRPDSSIAKKIEQSNAMKNFIKEQSNILQTGSIIPYKEITFESNDSDLYSAIHGGVLKNAYIDNSSILHIRLEDFYNFELRTTSAKAILGRYLQDIGLLIPYYLIIDLEIPKSMWISYVN